MTFTGLIALTLLVGLVISACNTFEERKRVVDNQIAKIQARKMPLAEPLPPFSINPVLPYRDADLPSPFDIPLFETEDYIGQLDPIHQKEPLEAYPLESLKMVGTLHQDNLSWGLVIAPDETLHRVTLGHYLGKNCGKIVQITDESIQLIEMMPDGLDSKKQRSVELSLFQGELNDQ